MTRRTTAAALLTSTFALLVVAMPAVAGPTPARKCEAAKDKAAGAYYACREKAESSAIGKGLPSADYSKCTEKFNGSWDKAENAVASACPDNETTPQMESFVAEQASVAAEIVAGTKNVPVCGDGIINVAGEQCDGSALGAITCIALGHASGTLACNGSCRFDTSGCTD